MARTMAQQVSKEVEEATSPFQYALTTRAGCECVAHVLQTMTDLDEDATIVSIDGIGAYDLISRQSMLDGLVAMENGDKLLPFVRSFYGAPSTYLWEDEMGTTHEILHGEGGEQGDPLMPLLFSLGQPRALVASQTRLRDGVRIPGRREHHLCARPSWGCAQDFARGVVEAREDSSPPRKNEDVESKRHHTDGSRRTHSISEGVGPRRSRVARGPRIAHQCPRIQSLGCSHWPSGFRRGFSGKEDERTRTPLRANPGNGGPPKRMVGPSLLRSTTSQLLVEVSSPRVGPPVCGQSRRQHVGVSRKIDWSPRSIRTFTGGGVFAVLAWGSGPDQCDSGLQSCALGQLD